MEGCSVSAVLCCRAGSLSARTAAAGAVPAEAGPRARTPLHPGLQICRFLPIMPPPFLGAALLAEWYPRPELEHGLYM